MGIQPVGVTHATLSSSSSIDTYLKGLKLLRYLRQRCYVSARSRGELECYSDCATRRILRFPLA
jgi:hypothetical protein